MAKHESVIFHFIKQIIYSNFESAELFTSIRILDTQVSR